ncbi:MAG: DUF6049 family protein [Egibacteraceae bacterium]
MVRAANARGGRRAVAVIGLLITAVFAIGGAAHAQQPLPSAGPRPPELQVLALSTVLRGPDGELRVELAVRNPPGADAGAGALRVTATLYRRTVSRADLRQAIEQGRVGGEVASLDPVDLDPLPAGATRTVELAATARQLGVDRPTQQGVYPLRLALERRGQAGDTAVDEVMTSAIAIPAGVPSPLRLALLVPVDHQPGLLADGRYHPRLPAALGPGATLDRLARELEATALAPLTLAPSGYLLEQVSDLAGRVGGPGGAADQQAARNATAFLGRLRDVAGRPGVEQVALPYGPADLVALVRAGLAAQAQRALVEGARAVGGVTGQRVRDDVLVPPDGLDPATLETARGQGIHTIVLGERSLDLSGSPQPPTTPTPVRRLGTGETVLVPDPFIGQLLSGQALRLSAPSGVVEAQRVLAETAAVYFERPFATQARGLLVATPGQWNPPEGLLSGLLTGIQSAPWLQPVGLSTLQGALEPDPRLVQLAYPRENRRRELKPAYLARLADARKAVDSLAVVLPTPDTVVRGTGTREATLGAPPIEVGRLDRLLLAAAAVWYRDGLQPEGAARIAAAAQVVDHISSSVRVEERPVTLTSIERQQVPVTITNKAEVPLRVRVRLEAQPVAFERGDTQLAILRPGGSTTLTFAARVLTPGGTFAANVVVEDPQGVRELARGNLQVRSAAYSIVALVLTAGAGAFLLAWWIREIVRRRRQESVLSR